MPPRTASAVLTATLLLVFFGVAGAQTEIRLDSAQKVQNESRCGAQAYLFSNSYSAVSASAAMRSAAVCPDTGAVLLAYRWSSRPTNMAYIDSLADNSKRLIDKRIADALAAILVDATANQYLRMRALEVMASQMSPTLIYRSVLLIRGVTRDASGMQRDGDTLAVRSWGGSLVTADSFMVGRQPMDASARANIRSALSRTTASDTAFATRVNGLLIIAEQYRSTYPPR